MKASWLSLNNETKNEKKEIEGVNSQKMQEFHSTICKR